MGLLLLTVALQGAVGRGTIAGHCHTARGVGSGMCGCMGAWVGACVRAKGALNAMAGMP